MREIIYGNWGDSAKSVLDVSCGMGTQSIGLAELGFRVTASYVSPAAVERAKREAVSRSLSLSFSVWDMRQVGAHHGGEFDVVLSGNNSIPHLLQDEEILLALRSMHTCLRPGGGCVITIRDYDKEERGQGIVKPYGIPEQDGKRYLIWQIWDFEGEQYRLSMYIVEDDRESKSPRTRVMRSRYYAISPSHLMRLMERAGFEDVQRLDGDFFQPVLVGTRV